MKKSMEIGEPSQKINSEHMSDLPSARGRRLFDEREIEETIFEEVCKDRWHSNHNPEGKIDLCNDHNNLCEELFRYKINKSWPSGVDLAALLQQFPTSGGRKSTKKAAVFCIRQFFCTDEQDQSKPQPRAEDLILTPGSDSAYDMLSFVLFSPGDVVLCPTPFTGRTYNNFDERAQIELRAIPSQVMLDIHLDIANFQHAFDEAIAQGQTVRAISLTQPHNPLGLAFNWDEIAKLCQWAVKNDLWILIDETLGSHIAKSKKKERVVKSFISLADQSDSLRQKLIWVWSVDRDLCLPGLRFSVIHTQNDDVHKALSQLEIIQPCAPLVQSFVESLFGDLEFMSHFYEKRNHLLVDNRHLAVQRLQAMGVPFVKPIAGTSVFLCLRKFIQENTFEQEEILWKRFMSEASIYLNPGMFMGTSDAGWFQLVISMEKTELQEALNRLEATLKSIGQRDTSADYEDSLSLSMLPAETSRVPDRPSLSSTGSVLQIPFDEIQKDGVHQQYESAAMQKLLEEDAIESDPSPAGLFPGVIQAEDKYPNIKDLESSTTPFPTAQSTSEVDLWASHSDFKNIDSKEEKKPKEQSKETVTNPEALHVLYSKPSIDSVDEIQLNKTNVSSTTDCNAYGHQPAGETLREGNHQKYVSQTPLPEKGVPLLQDFDFITQLVKSNEANIKVFAEISHLETEKPWDDEKYPHFYTQLKDQVDDATLLKRIFCSEENETQKGGDDLIEKVFSVFPASHLQWRQDEDQTSPSPDLKNRALLSQRVHYLSEQRILERQTSATTKKLSAIEEREDHLLEESHHPPRVPSHFTDFNFIEQLVSGGGHPNRGDDSNKQLLKIIFPNGHVAERLDDQIGGDQLSHENDHMDGRLIDYPVNYLDDHQNAIEFDLMEEFEPIPLKTPSPKPQLTIDMPLRIPLNKEEEVHLNTQFQQMAQSETQSERIIEIIEHIFLDVDVVGTPPTIQQQLEDLPWSRSDSGLAADHSNNSSTADADLGECHPLDSSTLKRVPKGPTTQRVEDSGLLVEDSLPGTLSIDFPLFMPMEKEQKGREVIAQSEPLFSASELRDLVGYPAEDQKTHQIKSIFTEDHLDRHLDNHQVHQPASYMTEHLAEQLADQTNDHPAKYQANNQTTEVEKPSAPPKSQNNSPKEFNFGLDNSHFQPATELKWQPIESLEPEEAGFSPPEFIFTLEKDEDVPTDQVFHFDNSSPQQYSEAQLLAMLSEGSAFCPIQEDDHSKGLQPSPSPLTIQDLNVQKKSDTGSTLSSAQKWEPLESFIETVDGSTANQTPKISENNPKYSDVDARKFSEDLKIMEKVTEAAPKDPWIVIGEYNRKVQKSKGSIPLTVVHSPVPAEPGPSLEKECELMDVDLRFRRPRQEEWLTDVVWIVSAEESQEINCRGIAQKKKSSKGSLTRLSDGFEKGEVSRFKVSLSEEEDIARRGLSPANIPLNEWKRNIEEKMDAQEMVEIPVSEGKKVQKIDSRKENDALTTQQHPQDDCQNYDYAVDQDHIYPLANKQEAIQRTKEFPETDRQKAFKLDNQEASTSKSTQAPRPKHKIVKPSTDQEIFPSIRVESSHPIYYRKPHWKHSKIAALGGKNKNSQRCAPQFVRICCPNRSVTPQVHHRMHMSKGYRNGDLKVGRDRIVMEHTNITEITYSGARTGGRIHEQHEKMSTSASTSINSFTPNEFFNSIQFMEVAQSGEIDTKECSKKKDDEFEHNEIGKIKEDSEDTPDLCCRMRVLNKSPTEKVAVEEKENERTFREYEYLVCKNPEHVENIDHCDPTRLFTIKRSTMPSANLWKENDRKGNQKSERITANFIHSTVNPANISVNTQRDGNRSIDAITLRHTPGSNWIVSSVCKTVQYCDKTTNRSHRKGFNFAHKKCQV